MNIKDAHLGCVGVEDHAATVPLHTGRGVGSVHLSQSHRHSRHTGRGESITNPPIRSFGVKPHSAATLQHVCVISNRIKSRIFVVKHMKVERGRCLLQYYQLSCCPPPHRPLSPSNHRSEDENRVIQAMLAMNLR